MYQPDVVYGLMRDDDEIAGTLEDLESHGIYRSEIDVRSPLPGRYVLADEYLHDEGVAARRGAMIGGAVGLVLSVLVILVLRVTSGVGEIGFLVLNLAGLGFGAMVGAMYGLQSHPHFDDDAMRYEDLDDPTGWKLVAVNCLHWRNRAHSILQKHGAVILDSPTPMPRA